MHNMKIYQSVKAPGWKLKIWKKPTNTNKPFAPDAVVFCFLSNFNLP